MASIQGPHARVASITNCRGMLGKSLNPCLLSLHFITVEVLVKSLTLFEVFEYLLQAVLAIIFYLFYM